ncbi:hypothetical protein BDW59DRAFT_181580 [Aspergillus cavernicola]|uniref:N-acetylgalactosaminide beta-1,3-galactosyltransferase n=1 Tax=Aspergillus cavernicola TaxID=176166 RepID=A0ABR4HWJ8_9EURO
MNWIHHDDEFDITTWRLGNIASASMEQVLVILKTGATEALEKVPVHIETTLRSVPHYVIFSDYAEDIAGVRTRDILRSVGEETRRTNPDFGIYNRLRTFGREGLVDGDWTNEENGPYGKPGNPGWKLDKWKFVPMIDEALIIKPDAQWYIFLEADTYIIWRDMMRWLSRFDPQKPHYLGAPMKMGSEVFAYGGGGIVLSNAATQLVSQYRAENFTEVERMTMDNWAGDHVLGRILSGILGVPLVWSWPLLVPSSVWEFEYFTEVHRRNPWCYPAVTYHHMSPQDIQDMWLFEQQWFRFKKDCVLLHQDIFKWHVYDVISSKTKDWDNLSSDIDSEQNNTDSVLTANECARKCSLITDCLQYSFSEKGCLTSKKVIGGIHRPGYQSGWMAMRVKALLKNAGKCSKVQYIT